MVSSSFRLPGGVFAASLDLLRYRSSVSTMAKLRLGGLTFRLLVFSRPGPFGPSAARYSSSP